ncbi:MAG: hypothetical protein ACFCA4_16920 [Cyanophyceae cyanobacterium]
MNFHNSVAQIQELCFFKEFTFSQNQFQDASKNEHEFADSVIWLDNLLIVYQLKERNHGKYTTSEIEGRWFKKNILDKAKSQIGNTLNYLKDFNSIPLSNHRGNVVDISDLAITSIHKVILYRASPLLPRNCRNQKYYRSRKSGFIHLFESASYLKVLQILVTPAEINDYLYFREKLLTDFDSGGSPISEKALLGQYLCADEFRCPDANFSEYVESLNSELNDWNISGLIQGFRERQTDFTQPNDYILCYPRARQIEKE